jgi:hypothetical protein
MKLLRVLAATLFLLLAAIGAAVWYASRHQNQLVNLILTQLAQRTGLQIQASATRLGLGTRLVVVLEDSRVIIDHREIARLGAIRAVFSYWALLHRTGLPLYALVLDRGRISVSGAPSGAIDSSSAASRLEAVMHYFDELSSISRQFELVDLSLTRQNQQVLSEHVNAVAYHQHYRHGVWPWILKFSADSGQGLMAGVRFAGELQLGNSNNNPKSVALGTIWFWELARHRFKLGAFDASAQVNGAVEVKITGDAKATGSFTLASDDSIVSGDPLRSPVRLGRLWSQGNYRLSGTQAEVSDCQLHHQQSRVAEFRATMLNPFASDRTINFSFGGIAVDLTGAADWLRLLRPLPSGLVHLAERIRSGILLINQAVLKTPQSLEHLQLENLARRLEVNSALTRVSYLPSPDLHLPPVYQFDAQLNYADGVARITQAASQIGDSSISDISLDLNLSKAPDEISYRMKLAGWLDVDEVYSAASVFIQRTAPSIGKQLLWVHGHTSAQLQARDTISGLRFALPRNYLIIANLGDVEFRLKTLPTGIWLNSGRVVTKPAGISLSQVLAIPLGETGDVFINGVIVPDNRAVQFHALTVELHQLSSAKWVSLIVGPNQTAVTGPIGGKLVVNSQPGTEIPTVVGKLTLDNGTVQPGFLRSPIVVTHSATLVLDGKGLILDLPASRLEGEPLDFRMAVADLNRPQLRIDANAARLNFEVMRFIRLPWSRSTPPQFFPVPVTGHIEAQNGIFDKLAMSKISTDFYHNSQTWAVENFRASAFNGSMDLRISGRARDDWINMKGTIRGMDAGPLFLLSENSGQPPILGKLAATGDLWANTSTDFFRTLGGTVSITITDGNLNRFTLLKRILSLVNLKNWLTAQFPDPRKAGIPFKTLDADFRAVRGNFYTDNLRLNGPVMDITARGNIDFATNTMDMEIDLLALQTVNWLINNIPIIGKNLSAATKHLVGAYFQVRGPTANPSIRPKPLTSVEQFVLRTLTLPINIVAPNTVE